MMQDLTGWDAAKGVWAALVSILAWLGIRARNDLDALKDEAVQKKDHERAVDRIESALKEHRTETNTRLDRIFERIDTLSDRIK